MTPERWARIRDVFNSVMELPPEERSAFLDQACADDPAIRVEVESLLEAAAGKELESPVPELLAVATEPRLAGGSSLGRYRIECRIGTGGMGEVYRAFDPELARAVALKILPAAYTADRGWRSRFLREARAASAISHPNVVRIFEVGVDDGLAFIAMEFIEGRSLDQIIPLEGLPIVKALEYADGIAGGLADAHARGVVHRDLKPANIMIGAGGEVKLLDFGLAKRVDLGGNRDATLTVRGEILGTPAYMSPEQAEGKEVDARSDIFSFGSLLYEMLSGRRAFAGDSAVAILGAILREEPPQLKRIPLDLEKLVRRCLQKDPARRVQHMGDVKLLIEELRDSLPLRGRRPVVRLALAIAASAVAGVCLTLLVLHPNSRPGPPAEQFTPVATEAVGEYAPAWSPDGQSIAYLVGNDGVNQVFVRGLGSAGAVALTRSDQDCGPPFWSTDGTRVFYNSGADLWSSGLAGGEPRLELRDARNAARSPDGKTLAFLRGEMGHESLWLKAEADFQPHQYVRDPFPSTFVAGYQPTFFQDGSRIGIVVDRGTGGGAGEFWILPLGTGMPRRVPATLPASAWLRFSWWTDPGTVLLGRSDPGSQHLQLMDLKTGVIRALTTGTGQESEPALSPDGRRIAFTSGRVDLDLVEVPLDGSPIRPLLATSRDEQSGAWLPSGSEYAFITNHTGTQEVWLRRAMETWARPILAEHAEGVPPWYLLACLRVSPDGNRVSYDVLSTRHWIWISSITGGRPVPLDTESTDQHAGSWSPDGKRVAYRRLHEGRFELATIALGGGTPAALGETGPGGHTRGGVTDWSPTGEWICHNSPNGLELVSPDGKRRRLLSRTPFRMFVFSPDGTAVLVLRRSAKRRWELATLAVTDGRERNAVELPVPPGASLSDMTRHPDGKGLLMTLATPRQDIWLMEGFAQPGSWWSRLWR